MQERSWHLVCGFAELAQSAPTVVPIVLTDQELKVGQLRWKLDQIESVTALGHQLAVAVDGDVHFSGVLDDAEWAPLRSVVVPAITAPIDAFVDRAPTLVDREGAAEAVRVVGWEWAHTGSRMRLQQADLIPLSGPAALAALGVMALPAAIGAVLSPSFAWAILGIAAVAVTVPLLAVRFGWLGTWLVSGSSGASWRGWRSPLLEVRRGRLRVGRRSWLLEDVQRVTFRGGRLEVTVCGRTWRSPRVHSQVDFTARRSILAWLHEAIGEARQGAEQRRLEETRARAALRDLRR